MKRILAIFLCLCIFALSVAASGYVIRSYSFDISGKTKDWVVRKLIVPSDEETFSSLEEAIAALDGKKQTLVNKRVFKGVAYTYTMTEEDDVTYLDVNYDIDDARTQLVLPYPKYDSNYGARIGLKYWNTNVLGTFSSLYGVVHATFMPWDFETTEYFTDIILTDLLIGQTSFSLSFTGNASQKAGVKDYSTDLSVKNIAFGGGYSMDINLGFGNSGSEFVYTGYSAFHGLKLSSVAFSPSVSMKFYEKSKGSSYITPSLGISGINIGSASIGLSESVKFSDSSAFKFTEYNHSASLSFSSGTFQKYGYSHSITYRPESSLGFNNTLSYRLTDATTLYVYENLSWTGEDFFFSSFDTGVGISQRISIGEHITITPTLSEYVQTYFNKGDSTPNFQPFYTISASASGDYINWKGNFREGIMYSFSVSESWWQYYSSRGAKGTNIDKGEIQIHKVLGSWFNPSFRGIINYTNNVGGNGFLYGAGSGELGEYIRGVRNKTIRDDERDKNLITFVGNLNLMSVFPLPSFMSGWMDAYINVFADYVFTKHGAGTGEAEKARHYFGFGVEGIGILKEYPSYPVRASLGFDLRKLTQYIKGESAEKDFYEIYIGLDFFF